MIIAFILGVFGGFTIGILISYGKCLAKDAEIKLIKKQNNKYKDFIDHNMFYDEEFQKKGSKDEDIK